MPETNEPDDKRVKRRRFILSALAVVGSVILSIVMKTPVIIPTPSQPAPIVEEEQTFPALGWVDDPKHVAQIVATLPTPVFRATEAFTDVEEGPEDVFMWDAARAITGDLIPPHEQLDIGSCTGFGTVSCIEHLHCVQAVRAKLAGLPPPEFKELAQEVVYGGARIEANGGHARFSGDGASGADAAKFVRDWGVLARGKYGRFDLTRYSVPTCRAFGNSGVPDELEPLIKQNPVRSITQVRSWEEARKAVKNGYPVLLCSTLSFSNQRDQDGFAAARGPFPGGGGHAVALIGVQGGSRPGGFILNSWGKDYYRGPVGKGNGSPAGYWADARNIDSMCRSGDCWAFSDAVGFPSRKTNWFAMPQPK